MTITSESQFKHIFRHLRKDSNGIWIVQERDTTISYPKGANALCFMVEDTSFWFAHRNRIITQVLKRFPPGDPILDVGGGNGFVSSGLCNVGIESIMIEPMYEGCLNARKRGLTQIVCATLEGLQLEDNSIDGIGLFDVLEHLQDTLSFLKNISRILKKKNKGRLYITVPAHKWLWSDEDMLAGHFVRYNIKSLTYLLRKAGLEVEYSTYFFSYLSGMIILYRVLPYYLGLKRKNGNSLAEMQMLQGNIHKQRTSLLGWLMNVCFNKELRYLTHSRISHGASLIVVSRTLW